MLGSRVATVISRPQQKKKDEEFEVKMAEEGKKNFFLLKMNIK